MALPIIETPTYVTTLPSDPKLKITYRPFLVLEEKVLLMAQETGDPTQMIDAMKSVVKACTFDKVNPNTLTTFDLEYLFLKLRIKSVGETANLTFECNECKNLMEVELDLETVTVPIDTTINKRIQLTPRIGITLKYFDATIMTILSNEKLSKSDAITEAVIAAIETIYDEDTIYLPSQTPRSEMLTFINGLNRSQMSQIEEFIASTPKLTHTIEHTCSKCNTHNTRVLQGIQSFFG